MNESPDRRHLDLRRPSTKAVDVSAPQRETCGATKEARLNILLYGRLADAIDRRVDLEAPGGSSVGELRQLLATRYLAVAEQLDRSRACVQGKLVGDDYRVAAGDDVEFLPPVSGG
jgi:molybdopterin converting factor small subunit